MKYTAFLALAFMAYPFSSSAADQVMCTAEYAPVCGEVVRQCLIAPCESDTQTFGNACMANVAGAINTTVGECTSSEGGESFRPFDWAREYRLTSISRFADFGHDRYITRQEMSKFLSLAHPLLRGLSAVTYPSQCDIDFVDISEADVSLSSSIYDVCRTGLMKGENSLFRPQDSISYQEFLMIIDRLEVDRSLVRAPQGLYVTRAEALEAFYTIAQNHRSAQSTQALEGEWQFESTTLSGADITQVRSRTITFSGSSFSYQICNHTSGKYSLRGSQIYTQGVISTQMYCTESSAIENAFDLDRATFSSMAVKRTEGSSGPTEYLTLTTRAGVEFVLSR